MYENAISPARVRINQRIESRTSTYEYKILITNALDDDACFLYKTKQNPPQTPTRTNARRDATYIDRDRNSTNVRMIRSSKTTHATDDAERTTTQTETEAFENNNETPRPTTHANVNVDVDAEAARLEYRLQGKAGYDRVLAALKKEQSTLRETRQYLFGRLLNLQLEEAVLRDHLNKRVNEVGADDDEA